MRLRFLYGPLLLLIPVLYLGCSGSGADDDDSSVAGDDDGTTTGDDDATVTDADSDGYSPPDDCNDDNAMVHPGATEVCTAPDGAVPVDENCNGQLDEGPPSGAPTWYTDADGDGYGNPASSTVACLAPAPSGYVSKSGDCDDTNPAVNPKAKEVCGDGLDNDCDGEAGACGLVGEINVSSAQTRLLGQSPGDQAGYSVAPAGDVNGDGKPDLLIGAPTASVSASKAGMAYVVFGPPSSPVNLSSASARLSGEATNDQAGFSLSSAGDVNGDGFDDILVGAPYHADGDNSGAGAAYLLYGPVTGSLSLSSADAVFLGEAATQYAGYSVAAAGDVNKDGYGDFLVGAYQAGTAPKGAGAVYLMLGSKTRYAGSISLAKANAKLVGESTSAFAGFSVSGAGDVNNDGYDDILVGAYGTDKTKGAAYLVNGPVTGTVQLSEADARMVGESTTDLAGQVVASAGDVNGDGYDDILVCAPANDVGGQDSGATYLLYGPLSGDLTLVGAPVVLVGPAGGHAGRSLAPAGDINDDGYADFLIGALGDSRGKTTANVFLLYGSPNMSGQIVLSASINGAMFSSSDKNESVGWAVAGVGDVNGDGRDDILLGVPQNSTDPTFAGIGYVFHGGLGL